LLLSLTSLSLTVTWLSTGPDDTVRSTMRTYSSIAPK
jgi:hypothetical protein